MYAARYVLLKVMILIDWIQTGCSSIIVSESKMDANVTLLF